jgi:serine phosphatase RsbU (regulator of sigma subunit)
VARARERKGAPAVAPPVPDGESVRWASMFEGAAFPAALWSGAGLQFRWANRHFLDLLWEAQSRFDLLGMPMRGFLSDTPSAVQLQDVAYTGQGYSDPEYEYHPDGGETMYWRLTMLPVPARLGDPYDVLITAIDVSSEVTGRRRLDAEYANLRSAKDLIDRTILSSLDAEEILQRVLVEATEALNADWGWIALRELDSWVFRNVHGWPIESIGRAFREDELSLPRLAAEARAVVAEGVPDKAPPVTRGLMERFDIGAFLLVPLFARGDVKGVMGFCWDCEMLFTDAHRELADKLAVSLALATQNARAYGLERHAARTLRSAFFTAPRQIEGLAFGHVYHSASGARVGGDFYDILQPSPGKVGLLIGDVSGHGVDVSGMTSLIKSAMRVQALEAASPESVVGHTNELVMRSGMENYASAFFGMLDMYTGGLSYCSAGHPGPVLVRPAIAPVVLPEAELLMGVRSGVRYGSRHTYLEIGDLLVLYTDGLTEAKDASGRRYGDERLLRVIARLAEEETEKVPEALFLDAFSFAEGELTDDLAIVALRRTGVPAWTPGVQGRLELGVA